MRARLVEIVIVLAILGILAAIVANLWKGRESCEAKGGTFVRTYSGGGTCIKGTVIQY